MKLLRVAVAAALSASALVAVQASAAPPCKMITDPAGDTKAAGQVPVSDPTLDITSIDFGSDKKKLTIVMRVAKASMTSAVVPVQSIKYFMNFEHKGTRYYATVLSDGTSVAGKFGTSGTTNEQISTPPAKIDTVKNEVRMTLPVTDLLDGYKLGDTFGAITLAASSANILIDTPVVTGFAGGVNFDSASKAGASYTAGQKNCVLVGK